jgi:putative CocE/NonD family hydrolase
VLVMGPWVHGGWAGSDGSKVGNVHFGSKTSAFFQKNIELPFFNHFLKGKGEHGLPEAYVFQTGLNQWKKFDHWPPKNLQAKNIYVHADGRLGFDAPTEQAESFDEFVSDPQRPIPFTESVTVGMTYDYMTDDQRYASRRPDVAVYQTEVLKNEVTLAGPIRAEMFVSTSGTDSDWIVKVIDVFPPNMPDNPAGKKMGGYQMLVRSEVIRGRFRNSYEKPEPFSPNEPTKVKLDLQDVFHTFGKGHRIMVHICSTWFPLVDRNPQKFVPNIFLAEDSDFIKTTQRVYRSQAHPTALHVGVLTETRAP